MKLTGVTCVFKCGSWANISLSVLVSIACVGLTPPALSQDAIAQVSSGVIVDAPPVIPQQVRYSGKLATRTGDTVEAVFSIYASQEGGEPLWTETQKVTVDQDGSYTVLLGSVSHAGLPQTIFQGGAARWLGVSVERAPELSRVLLSSVPYAMKSADTPALAGHPAGDFVTQEQLSQFAQSEAQRIASPEFNPLTGGTITGSGTTGTIPQFTGTNTIGNSAMTQSGMSIGVNEATPAATLDVGGTGQFRGTLMLPSLGTATTSAGARSQELQLSSSVWSTTAAGPISPIYKMYSGAAANNTANAAGTLLFTYQVGSAGTPSTILSLNSNGSFVTYGGVTAKTPSVATSSTAFSSPLLGLGASVYKSSTSAGVAQNWGWQAIPTGNNTSTPSSNISLIYGAGNATPAPTGFSIAANGLVTFVPGQTFPGGGGGTITGITTSSPLTGSGTSGSVALGLNETTLTTDITPRLETTFNTIYPQLATSNTFASSATFGNSTTTGFVEAFQLNGPGYAALLGLGTSGSVGTFGDSDSGYGVQGSSGSGLGVFGQSDSPALGQAGVLGQLEDSFSDTYSDVAGSTADANTLAAGVWGDGAKDTSLDFTAGVVGTAGVGFGGVFFNNNTATNAIYTENEAEGSSGNNPVTIQAFAPGDYAYSIYSNASGADARGVDALVVGNGSIGVYGESDGNINGGATPIGVKGLTIGADTNGVVADATGAGGYGIYAHANGAQDSVRYAPIGVYGLSENGTGVLGINTGNSSTYNSYQTGFSPSVTGGVWGDTSSDGAGFQAGGIVGTADNNTAGFFVNNSASEPTIYASNGSSGGSGLAMFNVFKASTSAGTCGIGDGNLSCTGQVKTLTTTGGARTVETYAMQSPENWMEDFGSGELQKGVAVVKIDAAFAETVTADGSYHVFITPNGDSEALYVINKTATSFEVRESKGGTSSLTFDYRIVGKRRGYEAQRLTDVTERFNAEQARTARRTPKNIVPASRGELEAQMVAPHPLVSRLAKAVHPAHLEATRKTSRIRTIKGKQLGGSTNHP